MTMHSIRWTMRALLLVVTAAAAAALLASPQAFADATDEYPIPSKQIETQCDAEQYLGRRPRHQPDLLRALHARQEQPPARRAAGRRRTVSTGSTHWMPPAGASTPKDTATNIYYEQVATRWGNWAKIFFNNKGVVAKATAVCMGLPAW